MEIGLDAILWVILVGIVQHTDLLMEIGHDAILCCNCAIQWFHNQHRAWCNPLSHTWGNSFSDLKNKNKKTKWCVSLFLQLRTSWQIISRNPPRSSRAFNSVWPCWVRGGPAPVMLSHLYQLVCCSVSTLSTWRTKSGRQKMSFIKFKVHLQLPSFSRVYLQLLSFSSISKMVKLYILFNDCTE